MADCERRLRVLIFVREERAMFQFVYSQGKAISWK